MSDTVENATEPLSPAVQQWIETLRSGKYEQGTNYLNAEGKLYCLGVACEIFKEELELVVTSKTDKDSFKEFKTYNGNYGVLPEKVKEHLGLATCFGDLEGQKYSSLYALNDNGVSFSEIADIIESKPKRLFKS